MQSSPWVGGAVLALVKRSSALLKAASFGDTAAALCGDSYSHCPGGYPTWRRYLLQPNMPYLVFRGCLTSAFIAPLLPPLKRVAEDRVNPFLDYSTLIPSPGSKSSSSSAFCLRSTVRWLHSIQHWCVPMWLSQCCRLCKMVVVPVAHSLVFYCMM